MTQKQFVLSYLSTGRSISQGKAFLEFNIYRLADVIYKLKRAGYSIKTETRRSVNGKQYAEYSLVGV